MRIVESSVELLCITPEPEKQIEAAGRTCYKSEDKITKGSAGKFVAKMRKSGHFAMVEHAVASFRIVTDRGISHQIVRHRLASYAQESTRYCNYSGEKFGNECSFILPPGMTKEQKTIWEESCKDAERRYFAMLNSGCSAQIARSVLPNSLKTEIVMTANFREWRTFISLRGGKTAHPQIQTVAYQIWKVLINNAPAVFVGLIPVLPTDIARCVGVGEAGDWREGCEKCLRRLSPIVSTDQKCIEPPKIIAFECEFLYTHEGEGGKGRNIHACGQR